MRAELLNPSFDPRLGPAIALAERLYQLHEAGQDYSSERAELCDLVEKPVSALDVDAAFGSIDPVTFARGLLPAAIPNDLTADEMLEMIQRICTARGTEFQIGYWLRCLVANTGDDRISDLIFWPDEYFGDGNRARQMSPKEILETALAAGRTKRNR